MKRMSLLLLAIAGAVAVAAALLLPEFGWFRRGQTSSTPAERPRTEDIFDAMRRPVREAPTRKPDPRRPVTERKPPRPVAPPKQGQIERLSQLLNQTTDREAKLSLLAELEGLGGDQVISLLQRQLDDPDREVRLAALSQLAELADPAAIPAVDKALGDQEPEVREAALEVLDAIEEPNVCAPLLSRALADAEEDVRDAAFSVLDNKSVEEQHLVFAESITSPFKDVRERTVDMISYNPSPRAFEILLEGLKDRDQEIVDEVKWTLDYFVSEEFTSYDQARAWWEKNRHRFDDELYEKR